MGFRSNDNASSTKRSGNFEPVPNDTYDVRIQGAYLNNLKTSPDCLSDEAVSYLAELGDEDVKSGKIQAGEPSKTVRIVFEVVGPHHEGHTFQAYFLFYHSNVSSMRMGRKWLGIMCIAADMPDWDNPAQLVGAKLKVKTEQEDRGGRVNVVPKMYWSMTESISSKTRSPAAQGAPPPEVKPTDTFKDNDIPF